MFVYRFEYEHGCGIYNFYNVKIYEKACNIKNILQEYDENSIYELGYEVHPRFSKDIDRSKVFGFDTIEKFFNWFPIDLLSKIINEKHDSLKFNVFETDDEDVVFDDRQCQFTKEYSNKIISCDLGCLLLKG